MPVAGSRLAQLHFAPARPSGLFNSSLGGNVRRAIDIHEGDKVDEAALKDLIRGAVALKLEGQNKAGTRGSPGERAASGKTGKPGTKGTLPLKIKS